MQKCSVLDRSFDSQKIIEISKPGKNTSKNTRGKMLLHGDNAHLIKINTNVEFCRWTLKWYWP